MTENARKANKKIRPDGFLYILQLKGFDIFKIGVSSNPKRRITDIDASSPFGTSIISIDFFKNVYEMEECVHDNLMEFHLRKEWFRCDAEIIQGIVTQIKELSENGYYLIRK